MTDPLRQPLSGPLGLTERSKHNNGFESAVRWYERDEVYWVAGSCRDYGFTWPSVLVL